MIGGAFEFQIWGAYIRRGLYTEGLIFGILRYFTSAKAQLLSSFQ